MIILIMGLPGAGKTHLAQRLAPLLGAVHFNADQVRATINKSLGFSIEDRIEHARRLGWMCQFVKDANHIAIADFVCPTEETRQAFSADYVIWMNTIQAGRYEDTNKIFVPPVSDMCITNLKYSIEDIVTAVIERHKVLSTS